MYKILIPLVSFFVAFFPYQLMARCATCYTNGLSGASIAIIIIISSFIVLFFDNKILQKFLNKF